MDRKQRLYIWITAIFVSALIASDLIGGKFFRVFGLDLSVGMIPFPLTFVLTDIVNEFYGSDGARRITFVGLGMAVFVFFCINVALALPVSPESPMSQELFALSFAWSARLYAASLIAYVIGQLLDITMFQVFLRVTGHKWLWLRATGSTVLSQALDSLVVNFVLLSGRKPLEFILTAARNGYAVKLVIAICMTPLLYLGRRAFLKYLEGTRRAPASARSRFSSPGKRSPMQTDERRSLALIFALLAVCLLSYFLLIVPRSLVDLGRLSLPTSYDFHSYFLPRFVFGSQEILHGRFPLWNPFEYGGVPFFATSQPEVLYPPKALLFALLPAKPAYWAFMVLHYVGLAVGFVLFAREQKISGLPLFVGAAVWTFAMPVLISNYHPTRIALLVPIPFVFLLVERLGHKRSLWAFLLLSGVIVMQILAGYPEISMDLGLLVAVHAIVRFLTKEWSRPPWTTVPLFAAAFLLAAIACAIQLLPMLEAGVAANRVGVAEGSLATPAAVPEPFMTPKLGIVPLFVGFGILGMFMRRAIAAAVGLFICAGISAGGWLLLRRLPGFGMVRFPYVWFITAPFYAAWLASLGAEVFLAPKQGRRSEKLGLVFVASLGVLWAGCCAVEWRRLSTGSTHPIPLLDLVSHNIGTRVGAALGIVSGLALAALSLSRVSRTTGTVGAAVPLLLSVLSHEAGYPFGVRPAPISRPGPIGEVKRFMNTGLSLGGRALSIHDISYGYELTDRIPSVLGAEESFVPWRYRRILERWNFVPMFGWFDWGAFSSSRGFLDALNLQYVTAPTVAVQTLVDADLKPLLRGADSLLFENAHPMGHAWVNYGVRKVDSPDEAMRAVMEPSFDPRREVVVEGGLAWSYPTPGEEQVSLPDAETRTSPNSVDFTVTLRKNGILVVSETFYPGWTVTVDKYPASMIVADYVLRGVELPPGKHRVRFEYRPKSVQYGAVASLVALAGYAVLVAVGVRRSRRARSPA